jgi:hypothetical protein
LSNKLKITFQDNIGNKYSIQIEGKVETGKIHKILEIYQTLNHDRENLNNGETDSLYNRLISIINNNFSSRLFTSADIREYYEDMYSENIKLAAVSTYLARFSIHGLLRREKKGRTWVYKLVTSNHNIKENVTSQERLSY